MPVVNSAPDNDSKLLSALSYIALFTGLPLGLIVYFIKKDDTFARFHAIQSAALWVAGMLISFVGGIAGVIITVITLGFGALLVLPLFLIIGLAFLVYILLAAYKSFQGEKYMIPIIGPWSESFVNNNK